MRFDTLIAALEARLTGPLPGQQAQFRMAPRYRQNASLASVQDKDCREAGVLALLFPFHGDPTGEAGIVLTARHAALRQHAGQVSFPGGRREAGEALLDTALRETHEEVGLPPEAVSVLGALSPLYIPPSNFCVYPFVGMVPQVPALLPQDDEVDEVLHIPLSRLLDPRTQVEEDWTLRGQTVRIPFFALDGYQVWGATAMMLAELLAVCEDG